MRVWLRRDAAVGYFRTSCWVALSLLDFTESILNWISTFTRYTVTGWIILLVILLIHLFQGFHKVWSSICFNFMKIGQRIKRKGNTKENVIVACLSSILIQCKHDMNHKHVKTFWACKNYKVTRHGSIGRLVPQNPNPTPGYKKNYNDTYVSHVMCSSNIILTSCRNNTPTLFNKLYK